MTKVLHRTLLNLPPTAITGEGLYISDSKGNRYIDASGGAAVSSLGHQHPRIVEAISYQASQLAFAHTGFFTSEPAEKLAEMLTKIAPPSIEKVFFVSGGSEAIESAIKLACQYFWDSGDIKRNKIIARRQSYHGNTLGALSVGGNEWRREKFRSLLFDVGRISPCYAYRYKRNKETDVEYALRAANELESKILEMGPETVAAFVAETIVGATAGAVPPVAGYFKRIREICDKYGILLILDEIMCGVGRTGNWFAFEQDDIVPDMVTIAKGLAAGYQPLGALLLRDKIYKQIQTTSGYFQHGFSFMGHPVACAAGVATLNVISADGLLAKVQKNGDLLQSKLFDYFRDYPNVGDIRGRGFLQAIEFVFDKGSKEPIDPSLNFSGRLKKMAFEEGLICYPMSGTIDGSSGDHVLLAPPFIATEEELDTIVLLLRRAIDSVMRELELG